LPYLGNGKRIEIFYGGASSGKSVFIAQKKVYQHLKERGRKTLVVRKVGKTLRHSTFAEIKKVITEWGLNHVLFRVNKSDMEITRVDGGSQFVFAGLDDVEKLKSIQGITDIWIEEATEITQEDFQQLNLRLRGKGGPSKHIIMSFNPVSALSWIKKFFFDTTSDNLKILKTTYKHNRFIDDEDKAEIERLKTVDPVYYQIYALGNWGVIGNLVYTNYVEEEFDRDAFNDSQIYQGLDWGYNDPSAFIKVGYKDGEIYIMNSLYVKGLTNTELMSVAGGEKWIDRKKIIIADSSEPARIKEWRNHDWKVRPAKKGKDSVKFGIDFIRRHKIHIHPENQDYINEIQGYAYREDKDGHVLEEPIDFNDHLMAAKRYAFEDLAHERKLKWG
jgi:phage terminase large subunit